jgi:hypothetical protein
VEQLIWTSAPQKTPSDTNKPERDPSESGTNELERLKYRPVCLLDRLLFGREILLTINFSK